MGMALLSYGSFLLFFSKFPSKPQTDRKRKCFQPCSNREASERKGRNGIKAGSLTLTVQTREPKRHDCESDSHVTVFLSQTETVHHIFNPLSVREINDSVVKCWWEEEKDEEDSRSENLVCWVSGGTDKEKLSVYAFHQIISVERSTNSKATHKMFQLESFFGSLHSLYLLTLHRIEATLVIRNAGFYAKEIT